MRLLQLLVPTDRLVPVTDVLDEMGATHLQTERDLRARRVISDREMIVDSVLSQLLSLSVAFLGAVGVSLLVRRSSFVPPSLAITRLDQVASFLTPSLLALAIAIAAGAVGTLALATNLPTAISGIAVVPAAAATDIGIVWNELLVVVGAVVLLVMNVVTINLTAYVGLIALG